MIVCFDADVLIYSIESGNVAGERVVALLDRIAADPASEAVGSVLLVPEVLTKPRRDDPSSAEVTQLTSVLARLTLHPVTESTAHVALALATKYGLRAADACHLATALVAGADFFVTNNRRDFPRTISEITVLYPEDLGDTD